MATRKPSQASVEEAIKEVEEQLEESTPAPTKLVNANANGAQPTGKRAMYREAYAAGKTRTQIAKEFETTYQNVYGATKDMESNGSTTPNNSEGTGGFRARVFVEVEDEDGTVVQMPRSEYIRQEYTAGRKRGEIAKELGVAFQIVYAATKNITQEAPASVGDELEEDDEVDTEDILEEDDEDEDGDDLEEDEDDTDDEEDDTDK